jgi:hypothetical protein
MISKEHCIGCDNFYNGNNSLGIKDCWMLKEAELISRKRVSIFQCPPWNQKPKMLPSCFSKKGYIFVKGSQTGWE